MLKLAFRAASTMGVHLASGLPLRDWGFQEVAWPCFCKVLVVCARVVESEGGQELEDG